MEIEKKIALVCRLKNIWSDGKKKKTKTNFHESIWWPFEKYEHSVGDAGEWNHICWISLNSHGYKNKWVVESIATNNDYLIHIHLCMVGFGQKNGKSDE